jgi:threonine dehydrogenase-like Zn-dependent dehydrogenase
LTPRETRSRWPAPSTSSPPAGGLFPGDLTFNDPNFHRRELTVLASRNALPADFRHIIDLIEHDRIDTAAWITHRVGHRGLIDVFPKWLAPEANVLKAIVSFD